MVRLTHLHHRESRPSCCNPPGLPNTREPRTRSRRRQPAREQRCSLQSQTDEGGSRGSRARVTSISNTSGETCRVRWF